MAGSPTFTADTSLDVTNGDNATLTGTLSVANSGTVVTGFNTRFTEELVVGDSISFTTDGGTSLTRIVEAIISSSSMTLSVLLVVVVMYQQKQLHKEEEQKLNHLIKIFLFLNCHMKILKH